MRDPGTVHQSYEYIDQVPTTIVIDTLPDYDRYDFDLNDDKSFKNYIASIKKKCVRGSFEYKAMIRFLREYMDMNKCSFYLNVNNIDSTKIRIEVHHEPLSLEDIIRIVYAKRSDLHEPIDEELVAKEVMYLHYDMMVGLIPLAETVHELVHNQYLFVPTTKVFGKYREFVARYKFWMLPEQLEVLKRIESASEDYENNHQDILSKQYIYIDATGAYDLPRTEDMVEMIKDRIHVVMDKPSGAGQTSTVEQFSSVT